jgi:phosphatidylserine/phosphatidylglycerophosphate/cardiolipin synthase-like enzyme
MSDTRFITDRAIYTEALLQAVPAAHEMVWIATADIKDLHVHKGRRMVPFLEVLADLAEAGVALRLIHAREPGPRFREDFDRYPRLIEGLERVLCPRTHFKCVVVDGRWAYTGSANLTGAGMGAKAETRRNFESGIVTDDPAMVTAVMDQFDAVWMGTYCDTCGRRAFCGDRI